MTHRAAVISGPAPPDVRRFLIQVLVWNVGLFGLLRLPWIEQHAVGALIEFQKSLVFWYGVAANPGILVNASCSGSDVMALCAGVTLAYPAAWSRRVAGAALGLALILALNAVRIASLYAVASDQALLDLLHLYVWPAALTLVTAAYVFSWIWWSERRSPVVNGRWLRFGLLAAGSLAVYAASVPWVFTSSALYHVGVWTTAAGGALLASMGASVQSTGNVLVTGRGAFQVTQECLFTPAIPLYVAALFSLPLTRGRRIGYLLLAPPLFFALGVARLLVLALPPFVAESPVLLAHGFYQVVAGGAAIVVAAHLALGAGGGVRASGRTIASLGTALGAAIVFGPVWEWALVQVAQVVQIAVPAAMVSLTAAGDDQGALALLPAFQVGLVVGLWMAVSGGRRPVRLGVALLVIAGSQVLFLALLGTLTTWLQVEPHALLIRGWAIALPLIVAVSWSAAGATLAGDRGYHGFWQEVGDSFPRLTGAASTDYYFENEKRLITDALGALEGRTLLKTDLWDEAKNTRILQWAADQGARVFGIDVSEPIVRQARAAFDETQRLRPLVSDVRRLPFGDETFDAVYSMGTIEHFAETEASVVELARILKPGGRLILGVPNRHDPFLRPLVVAALHRIGLYAYGYEKSYSRRSLRRMLVAAGLDVRIETGILFMPGWLRMLDLWCYTRVPQLARVTGALVQPFAWLDRRVPLLRRHGYLIASIGEKPAAAAVALPCGTCFPDTAASRAVEIGGAARI